MRLQLANQLPRFLARALGGTGQDDPYWDDFLHRPPYDPKNLVAAAFVTAPEDGVNPVRSNVHSPNVMSSHLKELGRFWGADAVGIVQLAAHRAPPAGGVESAASGAPGAGDNGNSPAPLFGILCGLRADEDPLAAPGPGGQTPAMKGLYASFCVAAYIRELGFRAQRFDDADRNRLAELAGLGHLARDGRLRSTRGYLEVAKVIHTDLPLEPDGVEGEVEKA